MIHSPYIIYTLHCCFPTAKPIHYTGITTPPVLLRRLSNHIHGYGSKFTKRQYDLGGSWHLVKLEPASHLADEWRVKAEWRARTMCPLCQAGWRPPSTRLPQGTDWKAVAYP